MDDNEDVAELAGDLGRFARNGIFVALGGGAKLDLPGRPGVRVSVSEIQEAVDLFPDEQMRVRMQQRIGLAPFIHLSQRDRNELFARSCGHSKWAGVPRSEQDRPLRLLARRLLGMEANVQERQVEALRTPYNRWDVLEYEVRNVLPEGDHGTATQTHWRRIRSKVRGLSEFRITQNANWTSGRMPTYKMLTGGEFRIDNIRETTDGGEPGFRFDFVVDIDPLGIDRETDIRWIREYEYLRGDLGRSDDDGSMVIAPIVQIHHAVMSIKFSRALQPNEVWEISNVPNQDRTVVPLLRTIIKPKNGFVSSEFFDLPVGYASGIGWSWGSKATSID